MPLKSKEVVKRTTLVKFRRLAESLKPPLAWIPNSDHLVGKSGLPLHPNCPWQNDVMR